MGETDSTAKQPTEGTMAPKGSESSKKPTVYPLLEQLARAWPSGKVGGEPASLKVRDPKMRPELTTGMPGMSIPGRLKPPSRGDQICL